MYLILCKKSFLEVYILSALRVSGFSLGRLHMGGLVQRDKALMGGWTHEWGHRAYGGDLSLIDYIIN